VDAGPDWEDDPAALAKVLAERGDIEAQLSIAEPAQRVALLQSLGREAEALEDAQLLEVDPDQPVDGWRVLMLSADSMVRERNFDAAEQLQWQAWGHARDRGRQGTTLHHVGRRLRNYGDRDSAAAFFEIARALRHGFADPVLVSSSELALSQTRMAAEFDAIVLSGGRGSRIGGAKPELPLAGWPLLDHVLVAVSAASSRIVVGPSRHGLGEPIFVREQPPGSGPVAAIAAAIDQVQQPIVAVLAADVPFIRGQLDQLRVALATSPDKDAAVLVDTDGRLNYLGSMWRTTSLHRRVAELGDGAGLPMRALYQSANTTNIPDFDAHGADIDTPDDLATAEQRITEPAQAFTFRTGAQPPASPLAWPRLELHSPS
jgi:molybdopterin-guanine dinucleotide biosynthesis protein A